MDSTHRELRMRDRDILVLGSSDISELLERKESEILQLTQKAYEAHGRGDSSLPHSSFLHFPGDPASRIIALPAYLGGRVNSAGVKWISSFPANLNQGIDRASAILILNTITTGRPKAIMEASIISARRTGASAALAARVLQRQNTRVAGLIGCGPINFEVARFLLTACPEITTLSVYDLDPERAETFKEQCREGIPAVKVEIEATLVHVLEAASIIAFATTAGKPHVHDLRACAPGATVLHISLRDLSPQVILASDNIVDDVNHVSRAQTSIHLAEQQVGHRDFIRCTLADILNGIEPSRRDHHGTAIFSPFGLGILDIALGEYVFEQALIKGKGLILPSFLPPSWKQAAEVPA